MAEGTGRVRRWAYATALLALGLCLGVVVGSLWELPRLLLRRLAEAPRTVALQPSADDENEALEAFRALQDSRPSRQASIARDEPRREERVPDSAPVPSPPSDSRTQTERVLADVAARAAGGDPGPVVQVASYADRRAADALVQRLRRDRFSAYVREGDSDGAPRFRVRVRPDSERDAKQVAALLESLGFATWITSE